MQGLIKDFKDVQIGDLAFYHPNAGGIEEASLIAPILWKGSYEEFKNSKYLSLYNVVEEKEEDEYNLDECDLVVLDESFLEGPTLYTYDGDPCSCVVFIKSVSNLFSSEFAPLIENFHHLKYCLIEDVSKIEGTHPLVVHLRSITCELTGETEYDDNEEFMADKVEEAFFEMKQAIYEHFN
jgi:hypothetical protein